MTALFLRRLMVISALVVTSLGGAFAQEVMLAYKYSVGQKLRYKVASTTLHEGSMFPDGRWETIVHLYYTLSVTAVDKEGTATVSFVQDSVVYWEDSALKLYDAGEQLNGRPITMWFSNRGMLLETNFPDDLSEETAAYLDGLIKDFGSEPPLPAEAKGVGAEWKNGIAINFVYADGSIKTSCLAKSQYTRKEQFRGRICSRIEYAGNLTLGPQRVGHVSGTMHHSPRDGKVLRVSSKTEATLYVPVSGGRAQMRISNTQIREALN